MTVCKQPAAFWPRGKSSGRNRKPNARAECLFFRTARTYKMDMGTGYHKPLYTPSAGYMSQDLQDLGLGK